MSLNAIFEQLRQDVDHLDKIILIDHIAGEIVYLEVIQDWVNKFFTNFKFHPDIQINQICLLTLGYFTITFVIQEGAEKARSHSCIKCKVIQEEYDKALDALILNKPSNCDVTEDDINKVPPLFPIKYRIHVIFLHLWTLNFIPPPNEPSVLWVAFPELPKIYYPYIEYITAVLDRVVWRSDKASMWVSN